MNRLVPTLIAGSAGALIFALGLQYLGGHAPCQLCVWERYAYLAVLFAVLSGWALRRLRFALWLAALFLIGNAVLSGYHVGIEQGIFALPSSCSAGANPQTVEELRALLSSQPPTCDQVSVTFLGLSLAGWNGFYSLVLASISFIAAGTLHRRA